MISHEAEEKTSQSFALFKVIWGWIQFLYMLGLVTILCGGGAVLVGYLLYLTVLDKAADKFPVPLDMANFSAYWQMLVDAFLRHI